MVELYRVIAYRSNGSVVATKQCYEDGINDAHDELTALDGVRIVETSGPFMYSEAPSSAYVECHACGSVLKP